MLIKIHQTLFTLVLGLGNWHGLGVHVGAGNGHWLGIGHGWVGSVVVVTLVGDKSHLVGGDHSIVVSVFADEGSALGESTTWADGDSDHGVATSVIGSWWARWWVLWHDVDNWDTSSDHLGDGSAAGTFLIDSDSLMCGVSLLDGVGLLHINVDVDSLGHLLGDGLVLGDWAVGRVGYRLGDLDGESLGHVTGTWHLNGLVSGDGLHAIGAIVIGGEGVGEGSGSSVTGDGLGKGGCTIGS